MSYFVLLLLLFLGGCNERAATPPVFIDDVARAPLLACTERDGLRMPGSATELSRLGDTAVVALFGEARTVLLLNDSLRVLRQVELAREGPHGVADPASVVADGDSLLIADAEEQRLSVLDWSGNRRGVMEVDFAPIHIARAGNRIAIAPAVMGRFPGTLLFSLRHGEIVREDVSVVEFADLTTKALANRVKLLPVPDGLVVLHQFFTPRALHITDNGQRELRVPLASALKRSVGYVPPLPLNDEALEPALMVASDAAVAGDNELLLLVRTGRSDGDNFEKAIMRTDNQLNFMAAYRLPAYPGLLGYLPRTRTAVLVDEEDRWYTCRLP